MQLRRSVIAAALAGLLASCGPREKPADHLTLAPARFDALPGWADDHTAEVLSAFRRSCDALAKLGDATAIGPEGLAGSAADWRAPCAAAAVVESEDAAARRFFEDAFLPFRLANNDDSQGLFTGYYEIELRGAREPGGAFSTPLRRRPQDLVMVELGLFRPAWRGERIAGRVENGQLKPFASRAEIAKGALARRNLEFLWVEDPVDAFFLEIQGSGRVRLGDGGVVRVGYDGQNGHAYVPIGRVLADRGALPRDQVSMQSIRAWLASHPDQAQSVMNENPSYVFFREMQGDGPIGAEGVVLTAGRSLAVDRGFLPLGVPLWLDATDPAAPGGHLRRLVVAQDTGGAIRGPVRGDVFWGAGADAAERAGMMKDRGTYYLLLPRAVAARIAARP